MALAAVACALSVWLAGPAHANGPVAGVPASVTAVQQAAAPVVTDHRIVPGPNPPLPPGGPPHGSTRPVRRSPTRRRRSPRPASAVGRRARREPRGNRSRDRLQRRRDGGRDGRQERAPQHAAAVVRDASKHAADRRPQRAASGPPPSAAPRSASSSAAADTAVEPRLDRLDACARPPRRARRDRRADARSAASSRRPARALPATATGHALRRVASGGWRNATATREAPTQTLERVSGELAGFAAPVDAARLAVVRRRRPRRTRRHGAARPARPPDLRFPATRQPSSGSGRLRRPRRPSSLCLNDPASRPGRPQRTVLTAVAVLRFVVQRRLGREIPSR